MPLALACILLGSLIPWQEADIAHSLTPGQRLEGAVLESATEVRTPTLDAVYTASPTLGVSYRVTVETSGAYFFELKSYAFDAYLVLHDKSGHLLAENDDGPIWMHSRLVAELKTGEEYHVYACALHGEGGPYTVQLEVGQPTELSADELRAANDAEALARIGWQENVYGNDSQELAQTLTTLAEIYRGQSRYADAEPMFERALQIREGGLPSGHPNVATSLKNLALLYSAQGLYQDAESLLKRALAIREEAFGPTSAAAAASLNNLAEIYRIQGRYPEALPLLERSLTIWEAVRGPVHSDVARCLTNLSALYYKLGRYAEAEPLMERALAIQEKLYGPEHPEVAHVLHVLGTIYYSQGRLVEAEPLYKRAIRIDEKAYGANHPNLAANLISLAQLFLVQGRHSESESMYQRALGIYEKYLHSEHPAIALITNDLATLNLHQGHKQKAGLLYERTLKIWEKVHGPNHPLVATTLHNLASLYDLQGLDEQAISTFERALAIRERTLGPEHPSVAQTLESLGRFYQYRGQHTLAVHFLERSLRSSLLYLDRELPTLSEADRFQLFQAGGPDGWLSNILKSGQVGSKQLFDLCLQWKGKVTRLQAASLTLGQNLEDPKVASRIEQLKELQKQLSRMVFLSVSDQEKNHTAQVVELRKNRLRIERELNRELSIDHILQTPPSEELQGALTEGCVLIDFYVDESVFAWVLSPHGEPELFDLGNAESMKTVQDAFLGESVKRGGSVIGSRASLGSELLEMLWAPLKKRVGEAEFVVVSPDRFLCELPFGLLLEEDGKYLLESHRFVYLSDATRLSVVDPAALEREGSVLAVGDINYFRAEAVLADAQQDPVQAISTRSRIGSRWPSLPATRKELQALRDLYEFVLEWESPFQQLDGRSASEENVRRAIAGNRYIHIATHGYFEPDHLPSLRLDAEELQTQIGEQMDSVGMLPGLLSGLVLAGVNAEADPNRDDGYLSAEEIQYLDLSECDLAVLSACETALGSKRSGEGLMSLRRALEVAGAKTVISSLWKVDDQFTARLMAQFYENYWEKGMAKAEALHQAKLRMLKRNRIDFDGNARPETWAAFVLSGDWE